MNNKVVKIDDNNLHMIFNNNFKTTRVEARFITDIDTKEVPILELLSSLLVYSSKKYNTRREFLNKTKDLYDAIVNSNIKIDGNRCSLIVSISFLNNDYSYTSLFNDAIDFLYEVIYNPNIDDGIFNEESYEAVKVIINSSIDTIIEDKSRYAKLRLFQILNENNDNYVSPLSDDYKYRINTISREELVSFYDRLINNSKLDILVLSNMKDDVIEETIKNKFIDTKYKNISIDPNKYYESNKKVITRFESDKSGQAKLAIACNLPNNLSSYEKELVMPIYNLILGGFPNSLFFKNIREKYSLCYNISSYFLYYENLLFIKSGIAKVNYDKTIQLIKKEMNKIKNGNFSESLFKEAKETYISMLKSTMDYPSSLMNNYYDNYIDKISLFNERINSIEKVSMEDIVNVANKINIHTIFLYGGDSK